MSGVSVANPGADRTLVAGIGNIFMGDDAFGCEVVQRMRRMALPGGPDGAIDVVDFGIRGMDLGYALMDGYPRVILVDTVQRGGVPGTVYTIEPEIDPAQAPDAEALAPHGMDPARVLRFIASLGERRPRVLLVACEPEYLGGEAGHMGLSDPVAAAVDRALGEIRTILGGCSSGAPPTSPARERKSA